MLDELHVGRHGALDRATRLTPLGWCQPSASPLLSATWISEVFLNQTAAKTHAAGIFTDVTETAHAPVLLAAWIGGMLG